LPTALLSQGRYVFGTEGWYQFQNFTRPYQHLAGVIQLAYLSPMLKIIVILASLTACWTVHAKTYPIPQSMAALGDSMTAGVLTPYRRQDAIYPWNHARILGRTLEMLITGQRESLAFRKYSWSTGKSLDSHFEKLQALNPGIVAGNFAQPTASSYDLLNKQIPALMKWSAENLDQDLPDYVTFLIGHNDLCGVKVEEMMSVPDFRHNIHESLMLLLNQKTKTRVLVVPMAKIDELPEVVGKSRLFPIKGFYRCENVWKTIPLCRTVTQRDSPSIQKTVHQRLLDFNNVLRDEVRQARQNYGDRIRFAAAMESYVPQPNDVAIDCFHANKDAQKKISNMTWNSGWWSGTGAP
jgi:hypothetical protein